MGCNTCSTKSSISGCRTNGGCASGGCNKMNVVDWLSDLEDVSASRIDIIEVRFKNGRKDFFRNKEFLDLHTGDAVVVNVPNGLHIGYVSLQGALVNLQMHKKGVMDNDNILSIVRLATSNDLEKFRVAKQKELKVLNRTKEIIQKNKLEMKLTDVEFQADNTKATFYYSADNRVDFRELIRILAFEFKIRVDMRQISLRHEASRLGGIGSCGRELCCSTWLTDFKSVSTQAARYQNLSLNPSKLSGQCGRLKCCLNYELETYMEALTDIPKVTKPLETEQGRAFLQKTDIFRKLMWFSYDHETIWHPVPTKRVDEILMLNKKAKKPESLILDVKENKEILSKLNNDLVKIDRKYKKRNKIKNQKYAIGSENRNKHRRSNKISFRK